MENLRGRSPGGERKGKTKDRQVAQRVGLLLGTFFGAGYVPLAPGTVASAIAVALYLLLWPAAVSPLWLLSAVVLLFAPAVWASGVCEQQFGMRDPGPVVVDEVLGQLIALAAVPRGHSVAAGWKYWLLGFILFRLFDTVKPFPAGRSEQWRGGWGVVADDCWAGVYAFAGVRAAVWLGM